MPHSLADLLVHVVFSTKGRAPLVGSEVKPKLYAYMVGIAKQHGCKVHIVNGTKDHVHMLLAAPTTACLALMRFVKGSSSRWVHQEFPAKRSFGWQRGFAAFSVSGRKIAQGEAKRNPGYEEPTTSQAPTSLPWHSPPTIGRVP